MKNLLFFVLLACFAVNLGSCGRKNQQANMDATEAEADKPAFFPVTNYIRGQINLIQTNPLLYTGTGNKKDSVWVKTEDFQRVFAEFLSPEIDSAHMGAYFKETKFEDKTLGTYTFTYEPGAALPANFSLQRWDVYIDPKTNQVKNIYLEKKQGDKTLQLIWNDNASCKIVYIGRDKIGNPVIEKEEFIRWDF